MLRHEVHHRLAAQVHLAVLLPAAEHRLSSRGGQTKLIAPSRLTAQTQLRAARKRQILRAQRVPRRAKDDGAVARLGVRQRYAFRLAHRHLDRAARGRVVLLLPHGDGKGRGRRVAYERPPVKAQLPPAVYACFEHFVSLPDIADVKNV